jgi:hypothetical protein
MADEGRLDRQRGERASYEAMPGPLHPKHRGKSVASALYGVIAIMSAELAYQPGSASAYTVAGVALLVGFTMALTHLFVELVKTEVERGSHVRLNDVWPLMRSSLLVLIFPAMVAVFVPAGRLLGLQPTTLVVMVPGISIATVMTLGFASRYALDRALGPAFLRGLCWSALSALLFIAKELG